MNQTVPRLNTPEAAGLFAFQGDPYLVLSLSIDVDARRQELSAVRSRSHSLLHQAREALLHRGEALEHAVREAALDDLERCRAFLDAYLPRGACRGLALFSCAGRDWWQDYCLPRPVPDRSLWGSGPLVLPTLRLLEDEARSGAPKGEAALQAWEQREREREAGLVRQLYDASRSGGAGVVGVPETLRALYLDEVQTLLIDADLRLAGCQCANCGALSASGAPGARQRRSLCPICGLTDLRACPDLGNEAIGDALARRGQVELLEEPGELRGDGGMGAVLRFKPLQPGAASPETRSRTGER
jgi:hypothetical protein